MRIHSDITSEISTAAVEDSMFGLGNPGFCVACGAETDGCEPDARNYKCEECGKRQVFGAEEIMIMGGFNI